MICALLVAAMAVQGAAADTLVVKDASRALRIPLVATRSGPMLRPSALAPVIPVGVRRTNPHEYTVRIRGVDVRVWPGLRFVAIRDEWHQLSGAPVVDGTALLVPLQFVAEIVPAVIGNGIIWDADRAELRLLSKAAPHPSGASTTTIRRAAQSPAPRVASPAAQKRDDRRWRVVVDAGHGGPDHGMSGPIGGPFTIREKDITLGIARRVGARLHSAGVVVVYTRTADTLIALSDRGRIANDAGGDLFLSIHVNAPNPTWRAPAAARGFETYFLAEAKTEDARRVEEMENEVVRFETPAGTQGDALSFIVADMLQNEHLRESSELAELVQRHLALRHPGPSRGVKQAGFRVLVTAFMPSVLIEVGFGTNPAEARYLASEKGQEQIAGAIAAATMEYLRRYERRVRGSGGGSGQ